MNAKWGIAWSYDRTKTAGVEHRTSGAGTRALSFETCAWTVTVGNGY